MKRKPRKARRSLEQLSPVARLAIIAGDSLAMDDQQLTDVMNELSGHAERSELADVLYARLLELLELLVPLELSGVPKFSAVELAAERARIEQRRGAGFVYKVSFMGTPASETLRRFHLA